MPAHPRALLISLRQPTDPMAAHEQVCFADRSDLPLDRVDMHSMVLGRPDVSTLRRYDAIFFGGSGAYSVLDDVDWIKAGIELCLEVIGLRIPSYASCFGFQGLAVALGGRVVSDMARQELGATLLTLTEAGREDALFRCLPHRFLAQEGHHDHVEVVPPGVTLLATGDVSRHQAFKVDGAPFWASQFHPELTRETTTARFKHYMEHYSSDPESAAKTLAYLESGEDSPECKDLLVKLVRHEF
jgi:GMP synthase (glutamine-hydrolysing)